MDVIYEDEFILIVNKPSNLVVTRGQSYRGETLEEWLKDYLGFAGRGVGGRAGIVHRLDKETSGLLLIAKTERAYSNLKGQFKERRVKKKYWTLVYGEVTPKKGEIAVPLARNPKKRRKFAVSLGGRAAVTSYEVLEVLERKHPQSVRSRERFSLLEVRPVTGRTHQIRVHLAHIGHSVVGDPLYGGSKRFRRDQSARGGWCPRLFLHAFYLSFFHPETGEWVEFKTDFPNELKEVLGKLRKNKSVTQ